MSLIFHPGFIVVSVTREQLFLVGARQAYLSSKSIRNRLSSRVVLFLFAPNEALQEDKLQQTFGNEAQMSWIVSDRSKLEKLVEERTDTAMKLEVAEVELSREANKRRQQTRKDDPASTSPQNGDEPSLEVPHTSRPKHRSTPVIGSKDDTIDWAREKLPDLQNRIEKLRENADTTPQPDTSAVFVCYSSPVAAQRAYRNVTFHPVVSSITPDRFIGVTPKEALWGNLTLTPADRLSRASVATALVIAAILFWSIPIGFVGAISNIKYLANEVKFLGFLNNLPSWIIGLLSGFLPPLAISTFVSYLPKMFRCKCSQW